MRPHYKFLKINERNEMVFETPKGVQAYSNFIIGFKKDMLKILAHEDHSINSVDEIADLISAFETCPIVTCTRVQAELNHKKKDDSAFKPRPFLWDYDRSPPKGMLNRSTPNGIVLF